MGGSKYCASFFIDTVASSDIIIIGFFVVNLLEIIFTQRHFSIQVADFEVARKLGRTARSNGGSKSLSCETVKSSEIILINIFVANLLAVIFYLKHFSIRIIHFEIARSIWTHHSQ